MGEFGHKKLFLTVIFFFQSSKAFFSGIAPSSIADEIGAKFRVLVRNPTDGYLYTMKGMEVPLSIEEIKKVLEHNYNGSIMANEFAFEVYDATGFMVFATKFNAGDKIPSDAHEPDTTVYQKFSWSFELSDENKQPQA